MSNSRPLLNIIFNPLAGPASLERSVHDAAGFWRERGWQVTVLPTEYAGHAKILAGKAASGGCLLFLAGGGDGTLAEAANGLIGTQTVLGMLPMGTGNSFAKELHMPRPGLTDHRALIEASRLLAEGEVHTMDVGRVDSGRYWLLWAGAGMDGFLVNQMEPRPKLVKRLGPVGYALHALLLMPRFKGMQATVRVDDREYTGELTMVTVANCRRFAGGILEVNRAASLDDGQFEIMMVEKLGPISLLRLVLAIRRGHLDSQKTLRIVAGRRVQIVTAQPVPVQADGDPGGLTPISCEIVPGALQILIPPGTPGGLFGRPGRPLSSLLDAAGTHSGTLFQP